VSARIAIAGGFAGLLLDRDKYPAGAHQLGHEIEFLVLL
jgi:hypothetical protein